MGLPYWGHSRSWGHGPSGVVGATVISGVLLAATGGLR